MRNCQPEYRAMTVGTISTEAPGHSSTLITSDPVPSRPRTSCPKSPSKPLTRPVPLFGQKEALPRIYHLSPRQDQTIGNTQNVPDSLAPKLPRHVHAHRNQDQKEATRPRRTGSHIAIAPQRIGAGNAPLAPWICGWPAQAKPQTLKAFLTS